MTSLVEFSLHICIFPDFFFLLLITIKGTLFRTNRFFFLMLLNMEQVHPDKYFLIRKLSKTTILQQWFRLVKYNVNV